MQQGGSSSALPIGADIRSCACRSAATPRMSGSPTISQPQSPTSFKAKKSPGSAELPGPLHAASSRSGAVGFCIDRLLGSRLIFADGGAVLAVRTADVDLPRLHRLGDLAHALDREQPVLQVCVAHLDVVGERKTSLERPVGDAAIDEVGPFLLRLLQLAASDDQHVLLSRDVNLVGLEAGDGELDAVFVLALLDEIEGRVVFLTLPQRTVLQHVEQAVEADRGTPIGRKIESATHSLVLL